jgi:hypothetical protein
MPTKRGSTVPSALLLLAFVSVAVLFPLPIFADPPEGPNQRPELTLSDVASRLDKLDYLAAVAPFKSLTAETSSGAELAGKLDEVFRYVGGRVGSRLSQLVKVAAAVSDRNQWSDGEANERQSQYKRRLVTEILKLGDVRRRDPADGSKPRGAESDETTWSDSASWTECRKDYAEFVEPITNALWNGIRGAVCDELGLPDRLCDKLINPLPNKTMPAWGWKSKYAV